MGEMNEKYRNLLNENTEVLGQKDVSNKRKNNDNAAGLEDRTEKSG